MKLFSSLSSSVLVILLFSGLMLCSCNTPDKLPTPTFTPEWTATPIPPTATPTLSPTFTPTPIPEYLQVKPEELEGITISLKYMAEGKARDKIRDLTTQFNKENSYGIKLQAEEIHNLDESSNINEKNTDLLLADSAHLRNFNPDGTLYQNLSAYLNEPKLSLQGENIEPIMPVMLELENINGDYFALPLWTEPAFLFYNKTWAIELGFSETPADLASFAEQVCAAGKANYADKDQSKHGTGGWIVSSVPEDVLSWLLIFAKDGETPGDILRSKSGDVFIDAASWLRNLFDNGCAWTSRVKEPYDYFANRFALFYSGTYSDAKRQLNAFEQSDEHAMDNWDLVIYPAKSAGKQIKPRIYANTASIAIINRDDAKKTNAGWYFIRWLYEEEHAAELALAAGGWPVQDNERITKLYRNSGEDKLYQTLSYRQYLLKNDADANWITDMLILSDGFGYIFNPSAKPEDIPQIWEQIGSLIAEVNDVNYLSKSDTLESTIDIGGNNETQP